MTITNAYTVQITRTENIEVTVTDATEDAVWENIVYGWIGSDGLTRAEYDELPDEEKAKFVAEKAVALGLDDFVETTGEQMSIFDIIKA